jgi:hypothetical protein
MKIKAITITKLWNLVGNISLLRLFGVLTFTGVIALAQPAVAADEVSAGFVLDRHKLTLEDGYRTESAGPFYYSQQTDVEDLWALPPFYSSSREPGIGREEQDILYPLFTRICYDNECRWQFFEVINHSSGAASGGQTEEASARRFTLFPFYFQQRSTDTNLNYTAVLPFYGHLKNRLFRGEISFVMFPAYLETRRRDVVTDNYFFPFVDVRHGDGLEGWQVWPFAGHVHKEPTTQTNGFGEVSAVPGFDHSFYLWPIHLRQDNGTGSDNPEKFRATIPFYAVSRSPARDSTSVLWPFFTSIDDRLKKYHEWQGPWPMVIFARGEGKHTSRVWPLFSESHNATKENDSYLWPVYVYTRTHADPLDQQRAQVLFFLYSHRTEKNTETGKERTRVDLWPFFTWHHELNGDERLQILAPLEPAVPNNAGLEHNWSPLWSLWRAEENPRTGARSQSCLWNLYRHDQTPDREKTSVCFGLYQRQAGPNGKSVRLFYCPLGGAGHP